MTRLVFAALATAALLLAACSDRVPAPATPTVVTPSPEPTPSPTARPPELFEGIEVTELLLSDAIDLPADTALIIETGCWQCDGPATGFARVYRDVSGGIRTETLLTIESLGLPPHEGEWEHYITGLAAREDGSEIVVSICTSSYCGGLGYRAPDAREALYRSTDGGLTWTLMSDEAGGQVVGIVAPGTVLMAEYREEGTRYFILPDNEPVKPPVADAWPRVLATGEIAWNTEGGEILRADGSVIFSAGDAGSSLSVGGPTVAPDGAVYIYLGQSPPAGPSASYLAELDANRALVRAFRLPDFPSAAVWRVKSSSYIGNVYIPAERIMPSPSPGLAPYVPAVFDLDKATISPIPSAMVHGFGRNLVVAFQTGPFARVVNTGSCLNVRAAPDISARVLECVHDGVLLLDVHYASRLVSYKPVPGWVEVRTPAGTSGWAAALYLER